jgi:hypothetical protein
MQPSSLVHLLIASVVALAAPAHAHWKGPTTTRPDSAVRPDKMQPAPRVGVAKPLTPQGPLAAPATGTAKPLTPQGPLAAPAAVAPRPGAGTAPNTGRPTRSSIDTHVK